MSSIDRVLVGMVAEPVSPLVNVLSVDDLDSLERHHLAPLALDRLATAGSLDAWPAALRERLRRASAVHALRSALIETELRCVVPALGDAGVRAVLVKGAALAYTHYHHPHLRPRGDTDVVIDPADRQTTVEVLAALGYVRTIAIEGDLVTYQSEWVRTIDGGIVHSIDVHWRVLNPHLFRHVLPVETLLARAVPIPALTPPLACVNRETSRLVGPALGACPVDALLLTCAHRVAHHANEKDLMWDYDVHLLVSALEEAESAEVVAASTAYGIRAIVAAGIASSQSRFGTPVPPALQSLLDDTNGRSEATAVFLEPGRRQVDMLASDLDAIGTWRARARLLREHLFPSRAYMRAKYHVRSSALLPFAYAHRIATGIPRWLKPRP